MVDVCNSPQNISTPSSAGVQNRNESCRWRIGYVALRNEVRQGDCWSNPVNECTLRGYTNPARAALEVLRNYVGYVNVFSARRCASTSSPRRLAISAN